MPEWGCRNKLDSSGPVCQTDPVRYLEFKEQIEQTLRESPEGKTWVELREQLTLPYDRPCPTWVKQLKDEIGLKRNKGPGRALVWTV